MKTGMTRRKRAYRVKSRHNAEHTAHHSGDTANRNTSAHPTTHPRRDATPDAHPDSTPDSTHTPLPFTPTTTLHPSRLLPVHTPVPPSARTTPRTSRDVRSPCSLLELFASTDYHLIYSSLSNFFALLVVVSFISSAGCPHLFSPSPLSPPS